MVQSSLEIHTAQVTVPGDGLLIDAYLAQPTTGQNLPALVVFQEIFGINAHIRDLTCRLAREGYVTIAPALYQRSAPGLELSYTAADIQTGRSYKDQTTAAELLSDTRATIAYLHSLPQVKPEALGCVGFCFGGHVAYLAATLREIKVTASFYGAGIPVMTPGGGEPSLSRTHEIQGRIELFLGDRDASIPDPQVNAIAAELQAQGIAHTIHRYDADHGFFCDQRSSYDAAAAQDAWQKVLSLFAEALK